MRCVDDEKMPRGDAQTSTPVSLRRVGVSQGVSLDGGVDGVWAGVARAMLIIIVTIFCILPSLWLGIEAQQKIGAGGGMISLVVLLVFLAPIAMLGASHAAATGKKWRAAGAAFAGILIFIFNLLNAIGSVAVSRATSSDTRGVAISAAQSRDRRNTEIERQVSQLQKTSQGDTPDMVRAAVRKLHADPVYGRSRKCEEGFVNKPDSKELCAQIAGHEARLAAAVEIEKLRAEQKGFWQPKEEHEEKTSASSEKDPQVAAIRAWLGLVSKQVDATVDVFISAGLTGFTAFIAEFAGTFGPWLILMVIDMAIGRRRLEVGEPSAAGIPTTLSVEAEPVKSAPGIPRSPRKLLPAPKKAKPEKVSELDTLQKRDATAEDVAAWAKDRLTPRTGSSVKAGVLQQDFAAWASERGIVLPNNWPNRFGAIMGDLGYAKVRGRYVEYQDTALKGAALKVVAG